MDETTDFSLETVPPIAEKVESLESQGDGGAMGIVSYKTTSYITTLLSVSTLFRYSTLLIEFRRNSFLSRQ